MNKKIVMVIISIVFFTGIILLISKCNRNDSTGGVNSNKTSNLESNNTGNIVNIESNIISNNVESNVTSNNESNIVISNVTSNNESSIVISNVTSNNIISNKSSNTISNSNNKSNIVSNKISNKVSNKIVSNKTSTVTSNKQSNVVSNTTSNKTSNIISNQVSSSNSNTTVEYVCPRGYELNGTKCIYIENPHNGCPSDMTSAGDGVNFGCIYFGQGEISSDGECPSDNIRFTIISFGVPNKYKCYQVYDYIDVCYEGYDLINGKCVQTIDATKK